MSRKPFTIAVLVALSALVLVAAGCGSKKASPGTTATVAPAAATTDATDTTAATTAAASTTASGGSGGASKDCQDFASAASSVSTQFSQALSGSGNVDLTKASQAFDQLTSKAPSAIKGDFQTIDDAFQKMASALKGVNLSSGKTPNAATLAKLQTLGTQIDQAKLSKAETDISTWVAANCH